MGIIIQDLPAAAGAQGDHAIPAMNDGLTVKLTVAQILALAEISDVSGLTDALAAKLDVLQPRVDVASAATANIGAAASAYVNVTGTATITSFGTVAAGTWRRIRFNAALTLTHNGTSLVLPNGGANIVTAAGDHCVAISMGSGNWVVVDYRKASPAATDSQQGVVELATTAEVATGTDAARVPTVATMGSHQGVAKAWVKFNGTGTVAILDSFNVSSITDGGTGLYAVNFASAMANANYAAVASASAISVLSGAYSTSALGVATRDSSFTLTDSAIVTVAIFGD